MHVLEASLPVRDGEAAPQPVETRTPLQQIILGSSYSDACRGSSCRPWAPADLGFRNSNRAVIAQ